MQQPIITVNNLSYSYPSEQEDVLKDISFAVNEGEIFGIVGPSGCGKSTLMLALSGLIPHSIKGTLRGTVALAGKETTVLSMAELSQTVQLLFQSPDAQLFALNVEDEIHFGLENLNLPWKEIEERTSSALKTVGIIDLRQRSLEELSSGQKQRVALASVLAMAPKILLFDEPTANLDPPAVKSLLQTIQQLRKKHTVIIIEHNVDFIASICDRVLLMHEGKSLKCDTPKKVMASAEYQKSMAPVCNHAQILERLKKIPSLCKNETLLKVEELSFTYPNKIHVLSNLSLEIGKGDFLGILGMNGSGKSTLALNLIGLLKGKGRIVLAGKDISNQDAFQRTRNIGYVFQNPNYQLFEENLDAEIAFGPRNLGLKQEEVQHRVEEALRVTHLAKFRTHDPHALSVGQKRRVSIASILAMQPEIIIVDEPDTGLDHKTARSFMDYIRKLNKEGRTIILISHNLELLAEYCTRIIALKNGKVVNPVEIYKEYVVV